MSSAPTLRPHLTDPDLLVVKLADIPRVVFDLDGTLYDTRDFERPALASVVEWLRARSGQSLEGLLQALWARRETDRHRVALFDELLSDYGLPVEWGAECAIRFQNYRGVELTSAASLRSRLSELRSPDCRLALVSNGRPMLQKRKLDLLGFSNLFDICVYCDPECPGDLKPSVWGWNQLASWRAMLPVAYVGDDPVDAAFALEGSARFIPFTFRNPVYGN